MYNFHFTILNCAKYFQSNGKYHCTLHEQRVILIIIIYCCFLAQIIKHSIKLAPSTIPHQMSRRSIGEKNGVVRVMCVMC
jgi:hypothetical protein